MNRTILITGSSRGIGGAIASAFADMGDRIIINYKNNDLKANELANKLRENNPSVIAIKADISDSAQVDNMIRTIKEQFGPVDVLINNAGIALEQKLFTDATQEDIKNIINTNIIGLINVTKSVIPDMVSKKSGNIINITSMWGETGGSCEVLYSMSKAAVIGFTKSLAKELAPSSIRVNAISPGMIDTDMNKHLTADDVEAIRLETPLERIGTAKDVANAAVFLASDNASFITGEILRVNGGILI